MLKFLQNKKNRVDYLRGMLGAFAHENKDLVIIVADPESDYMFVSYKDKMVLGKVKSIDGEEMKVVESVVRQSVLKSRFDFAVDLFTAGLVDLLKLGVKEGNQFYRFISDVLFNFQGQAPKWLKKQQRSKEILENKQ